MDGLDNSPKIFQVSTVSQLWDCAALLSTDQRAIIDYVLGPVFRGGGFIVAASTDDKLSGMIWGVRCQDPMTLYVPYRYIAPHGRGRGLYAKLNRALFSVGRSHGLRYAFGLVDPENHASNKGMERSGYHLIYKGKRFYYPDAEGFFYFIDLEDEKNSKPPEASTFWCGIFNLEPLDNV